MKLMGVPLGADTDGRLHEIAQRRARNPSDPFEAHLFGSGLPDFLVVRQQVLVRERVTEDMVHPLAKVRRRLAMRVLDEVNHDVQAFFRRQRVDAVLEGVFDVEAVVENAVSSRSVAHVAAKHSERVCERLFVLAEQDVPADVRAKPALSEAARKPARPVASLKYLAAVSQESACK